MNRQTLELQGEFIPLDALLKVCQVANSGGQAKSMVGDGLVTVDGEVELRKTAKIRAGQTVVLMDPADQPVMHQMALVLNQLMREAGITLDVQSMDWGSVVTRRAKKDSPAQGGWNIFLTGTGGVTSSNPVLHTWIGAACDKGLFGWPCDPEVEKLRSAFGMAATEEERKKIARDLQTRAMDDVVFLPFGQWDTPLSYRADRIDGIVPNTGLAVLWGITKK